ncbi:MAG: hypothetical protein KZQ70_13880 [gamma proteobacterium symbiont of Lucinoma myriamae]|nr:hypothetical protein [gamma proteobacterium symbiont of Lucinoma myriamae]MCU7818418.1 hypothetical protein [gamma proteobacterium symbiont of Lucinoma myriamae]MCU7833586.1 hypothetical protein [gamma proteobacterium symbiont of Lucinoma myriamae]
MTSQFIQDIKELEHNIGHLGQFKAIAESLTEQIKILEKSAEHIKYEHSSDNLTFSPKIYLKSVSDRDRNLLFYCGKGIKLKEAILMAYDERKNLQPERLALKLTEKACAEVGNFEKLAITCYQYMLKNTILFNIEESAME